MLFTKRIKAGLSAVAVLLVAALTVSAFADSPKSTDAQQRQVTDQLTDFKNSAYALRREADTLGSRAHARVSRQTHTHSLQNVRDHVNELGKSLAELEAMKPMASDGQKMAIENAREHLVSVAQNTTRAIELINDNRTSVHFSDYIEAVKNIQTHSDALHTKLDTVLDFEDARERLEALDLQPMLTEGS